MDSFQGLGLTPDILATLEAIEFTTPTPIQVKTIPIILENKHDIIGLAQTGTGKTAAYGLPLIQMIDKNSPAVQGLVLCPTRELCMQITKDMQSYTGQIKNFKTVAVYGGASIQTQIRDLKNGCQIVVGTPGRVIDLINRKVLKIKDIQFLILDEADEMLNMGFLDDIDTILAETPETKRTHLFSATMPVEIQKIAKKYMHDAVELSVGKRNEGASDVRHLYYLVSSKERFEALQRIADLNPRIYGIIFCRTRIETKEVAEKMISHGYNADALHGDLAQSQRDHVMHRFRTGNLQMLVATDVAARGLDVNDLTHIINYNLPDDNEIYLHRSGRTGRAGKSGISISLVTPREQRRIKEIERLIGKNFKLELLPSGKDICEKQLFSLIDNVEKVVVNDEDIESFLPVIYKKLDWLSREDLIKHFVSVEFNRFLELYKNAPDLNARISGTDDPHKKRDNHEKGDFVRLKVNVGKINNLNPARLIGLINDTGKSRDIRIGKIDIMQGFALIEVEKKYVPLLLTNFVGTTFEGKDLIVNEDQRTDDRDSRYGGRRREYDGGKPESEGRRKEYGDRKPKFGEKRRDKEVGSQKSEDRSWKKGTDKFKSDDKKWKSATEKIAEEKKAGNQKPEDRRWKGGSDNQKTEGFKSEFTETKFKPAVNTAEKLRAKKWQLEMETPIFEEKKKKFRVSKPKSEGKKRESIEAKPKSRAKK